jgi:hypothetical protein
LGDPGRLWESILISVRERESSNISKTEIKWVRERRKENSGAMINDTVYGGSVFVPFGIPVSGIVGEELVAGWREMK